MSLARFPVHDARAPAVRITQKPMVFPHETWQNSVRDYIVCLQEKEVGSMLSVCKKPTLGVSARPDAESPPRLDLHLILYLITPLALNTTTQLICPFPTSIQRQHSHHNVHQLVDSRQPLRRRLRSIRSLRRPRPQVSRHRRHQNRKLGNCCSLPGMSIKHMQDLTFFSSRILTITLTAHPLRRPRSSRNSFPRQATDLGQVASDRRHDYVQRLDLLAGS